MEILVHACFFGWLFCLKMRRLWNQSEWSEKISDDKIKKFFSSFLVQIFFWLPNLPVDTENSVATHFGTSYPLMQFYNEKLKFINHKENLEILYFYIPASRDRGCYMTETRQCSESGMFSIFMLADMLSMFRIASYYLILRIYLIKGITSQPIMHLIYY